MSLSLNSAINTNSKGLLKALKAPSVLLLLNLRPNLWPNKLGITKKIPSKTFVVPKYQGNDGYLSPKASRYFDYSV